MTEQITEQPPGATVTPTGSDVLLSVRGLAGNVGEAEILISTAEARRLALRLLNVADEQERQRQKLEDFKRRFGLRRA